jgi:DNA-binding CsgD family transcriptional regulator
MVIVASVDEAEYRQSRLCRPLGNPIAFTVVNLLAEGKEMNTSEIAKAAGRSVSRVSNILGALRLAEVGARAWSLLLTFKRCTVQTIL